MDPLVVPQIQAGSFGVEMLVLHPGTRMALYVVAGLVVSLLGVRVSSYLTGSTLEEEFEDEELVE